MEKASFINIKPEDLSISQKAESIIRTALNIKMMRSMIEDHAAIYRDPKKKEQVHKAIVAELFSRLEKELKND